MDPNVQAEIERQQSQLLEKLSTIFDNKIDSMKRQLEDVSNKAHESQMSELKRMRFAEPRSFKKKGHEQQYKHNEKVKTAVTEAKEAILARKQDACIAKLDEGIELIEGRQKLILMADRSDFGWKTVGEYLDNELAENDEDANKMKKAEKEAQRKITEARASKMAKSRASFSRLPRPVSRSSSFPTQYASPGTSNHHTFATVGVMSASDFRGQVRRSGTCFSCGKVGHWRNECPLLAVAQTHEGKKLSIPNMSVNSTGVILQNDDTCNVISCQQGELGGESDDLSLNEGDFLENDPPQADQIRGRLRAHLHSWEEIGATEPVLSIIREGYKLPLLTIPQSVLLRNNKSAFDNCSFVSKAIADLLANQCVDVVDSQPWVVNPLSVSVRDDGKKRLVLDLRHVNPHLYKYKFKCEDIAVAQLLLGEGYYLYTFDIKSAYHHVDIFESHRTYLGFQWQHHGKPTFFVFNVLPFGLSTAPYTFTKLLKPVVSHWRGSGIRVCMFLDDGFGGNSSLESASADAQAVETCLCALDFTLSSSLNLFSQGIWAEIQEQATSSGSAHLIHLAGVLKRTTLAAKASGTVVNYSNSLKHWIEFSKDRNLVPFPATVVDVALFFSHLTSIGVSASVIETIYSALKWVHDIAGVTNPMTNPFVKTVVEGAKRANAKPVVKKTPISKDVLKACCEKYATCNELPIRRNISVALLLFAGFFRASLQVSLLRI